MSSPRKYASPYLTGIRGLATSPGSISPTVQNKPKKKSKTSISKLSDSAAALKQIQDGIWQNTRQNDTSFDDASASGGLAVGKILDEIRHNSTVTELIAGEGTLEADAEHKLGICLGVQEAEEMTEASGASALVSSRDSILLKQESIMKSSRGEEEVSPQWDEPTPEEKEEVETNEVNANLETEALASSATTVLKSILKKPRVYVDKKPKESVSKKGSGNKSVVKTKYGKPQKEAKEPPNTGRGVTTKIKTVSGPTSLEVYNKFSNNNKLAVKSPRKKSKTSGRGGGVTGSEVPKGEHPTAVPKKSVRFSNKVDVHAVPYEPRAGSRACDWQRNMLEQRVQTFRQLMKEVGGNSEELDLFGSSLLFPGYPSYHVPNPNFALRGGNSPGLGGSGGLVGLPARPRNNFKL